MDPAQEWCLQCGAGVPGSLVTRSPHWRSTATVLGATAILVVGAAAAAYAALSKTATAAHRTTVVAQTPPPAPVTPATPTPAPTAVVPPATTTAKTPTLKPGAAGRTVKPPKIPLTPAVPKATTPPTVTTPAKATPKTAPPSQPHTPPITLDTNAVTTYNPNSEPATAFGDPSLAIDGETSTGWTVQVDPAIAPKMAAGLVVDLNTPRRLSEVALVTPTPGMTIQIFGSNAAAVPAAITDPAWIQLTSSQVEKKRHVLIPLRHSTTAFRFVMLWISGAPAASVGTPQAPGRVSVNELELFPAK
jgi:hypothetical protein